jgi:23S rRNA (cytidine1920-2'-O)/16S rRNA (cytidine1409-2'-O)-methyltransferase
MRLDQALVKRNLCESRVEAQECIKQGFVLLDGLVIKKRTKEVSDSSEIIVTKNRTFVSRGGDKLNGALKHIYHNTERIREVLANTSALDVGASTGGFTDCLLSYGASAVITIDVGTSQLHEKLRTDTRVNAFENTDIRTFTSPALFDVVVADLSFISLEKILDTLIAFGKKGAVFFILLKPQFEVGKGNTKKGIVKDKALVDAITQKYITHLQELSLHDLEVFPCVIPGGDGNQEYFLYCKK